jgi:hypothetical protein
MNPQIRDLFRNSEGRYFDDREQAELEAYAAGLLARVESIQAIERAEPAILEDLVTAYMTKYKVFVKEYGGAGELLVRRDQALILRYASYSMLMHDKNFIYDKVAVWLRTILNALCKTEQVLFGYHALIDACRRNLPPDDAEALIPYIKVVITEFEQNGVQPS